MHPETWAGSVSFLVHCHTLIVHIPLIYKLMRSMSVTLWLIYSSKLCLSREGQVSGINEYIIKIWSLDREIESERSWHFPLCEIICPWMPFYQHLRKVEALFISSRDSAMVFTIFLNDLGSAPMNYVCHFCINITSLNLAALNPEVIWCTALCSPCGVMSVLLQADRWPQMTLDGWSILVSASLLNESDAFNSLCFLLQHDPLWP